MSGPKAVTAATPSLRWLPWVVVGLLGALGVVGLADPFGNGDEVIYAQSIREMQASGSFTELTWQGVEVLQRPVAPFTVTAAISALVPGEFGLRLGSFLAFFATLLVLALGLLRAGVRPVLNCAALLLCASSPTFLLFSRSLLSDPFFVLAVAAALALLIGERAGRGALIAAAAALGAAVAFKSLAAAIPILALAPLWVERWREHGDRRTLGLALAAFAALALPFFVLGLLRHGERFVSEHIVYSLLARARGDLAVGMPGGVTAYLAYLWEVDGPWTLGWVLGGPAAAIALGWQHPRRPLRYVGLAALVLFALLSAVGTRLPHYLLPALVTSAVATALALEAAVGQRARGGLVPVLALGCATLVFVGLPRQPQGHFLPEPAAVFLGHAADAEAPADAQVLIVEWYAPAFGYYANRPFTFVTASEPFFAILDDVDFFRHAGVIARAPVAGAPVSPRLAGARYVAGPLEALQAARWLQLDAIVANAGPFALARGRVVSPPPL